MSTALHTSDQDGLAQPDRAGQPAAALGDRLFRLLTGGAAWLVLILLLGAAGSMAWGGREAFQTFGWSFITSKDWDAVGHQFGALVPIYGTIVSSLIAMIVAVPISFGIATFLAEVAPRWMRGPIGMAIELLAAVPSIIYGMWGLFVFAPFMSEHVEPWLTEHWATLPLVGVLFDGPPIGIGMLTAGIILGIMTIPFISSVMRDVFQAIPPALRDRPLRWAPRRGKWSARSPCLTRVPP
jgi:phosphate transport system permease protein